MGESIAEGTIVRWIKKVGDSVDRDEPLFEISTDKVDAEIPSPAAGVLIAIAVKEGETVPVNSVVATIGAAGEAPDAGSGDAAVQRCDGCRRCDGPTAQAVRASRRHAGATVDAPAPPSTTNAAPVAPAAPPHGTSHRHLQAPAAPDARRRDGDRHKSSPLVRRSRRNTTSTSARSRDRASAAASPSRTSSASSTGIGGPSARGPRARRANRALRTARSCAAPAIRSSPMSVMRKKIAEHMVLSKRTSAHVYSVFEVNYSRSTRFARRRRTTTSAPARS